MAKFYYDFKFACESMGVPAPSSEFFNTPMIALTSLATACAALEGLGSRCGRCLLIKCCKVLCMADRKLFRFYAGQFRRNSNRRSGSNDG